MGINEMKDNLQQKWLSKSTLEELEGGILENCLGCEILIVGLKSDLLQSTLNEEGMTEQHADLLQFQLSEECLKLGAALFYCSAKEPRTVETLRSYILNSLFEIESDQLTPRGVSREALFIPIGWDTYKRNNLLKEGPELPTTIVAPRTRPTIHEQELTSEDEQQSLHRVEQLLEQTANNAGRGPNLPGSPSVKTSLRPSSSALPGGASGSPNPTLPRPSAPTVPKISGAGAAGPTGGTPGAGGQANERMLAEFFNQLLLKNGPGRGGTPKSGGPPGSSPPGQKKNA